MKRYNRLTVRGRLGVILFGVTMGAIIHLGQDLPWWLVVVMPLAAVGGCRESFFGLGLYGEDR